jgi:hypothetical protein
MGTKRVKKKIKNSNGMGSVSVMKDGRLKWRQVIDGTQRQLTAKTRAELEEKIKKVADLPIVKNKYKVSDWF